MLHAAEHGMRDANAGFLPDFPDRRIGKAFALLHMPAGKGISGPAGIRPVLHEHVALPV